MQLVRLGPGGSLLLLALLAALTGPCVSRLLGVRRSANPFVFDPKAKCEPSCKHSGICIRNNTCFCMRGYEGETCQYGDVPLVGYTACGFVLTKLPFLTN